MSVTLAESAKLSNDVLLQGVIETIIKDSPILQVMPFIEITGNGLTYNRETALAAAVWHAPLGDWVTPTAPTFDQLTATLSVLGRNADVDAFIKKTRSNIQDVETAVLMLAAKSLRQEFERAFIYGCIANYLGMTGDANSINGLVKLIATGSASSQVLAMGATGATLTLNKLDELIDAVKGGKPSLLMMSKRTRRKINALARASGSSGLMETEKNRFGEFINLFNGIPIAINDFMKNTHHLVAATWNYEDSFTSGSCGSIYAMQFGEGGLCGLTGPGGLQVEPIGKMETKDASRTRIKWYVNLALFSQLKAAALIGIKND